jgi:hypothetical protein
MASCEAALDTESSLATVMVSVAPGCAGACASAAPGIAAVSTNSDVPTADRSEAIMIRIPL